MSVNLVMLLLLIGFLSGIVSGLFGIGGGVLIVPGLILLPPVGFAVVIEYD